MMYETDSPQIELGLGGLILNVEANEELLKKIQGTEPLPTADLLKLAIFLRKYMTNIPLGDHLELVGLRQIIYKPDVQQALITGGYLANKLPLIPLGVIPEVSETEDFKRSWLYPLSDGGTPAEEKKDPSEATQPTEGTLLTQVTWESFSGVGLLIEIAYYKAKDGSRKEHYYVIGVSPDPRKLQPDAQGRISRVRINTEADPARNEQA